MWPIRREADLEDEGLSLRRLNSIPDDAHNRASHDILM